MQRVSVKRPAQRADDERAVTLSTPPVMDVREIPIDQLHVSALNTRNDLHAGQEDSGHRELAASIESEGLLSHST